MATIELEYVRHPDIGAIAKVGAALRRMQRRRRLLARIQRRNADLAFITMAMDERKLFDLGLQNRRRRYNWIGQMVMAVTLR